MDQLNLDNILAQNINGEVPEDVIKRINPWMRAMKLILAGLVLSTVTFRIGSQIVPAFISLVGMIGMLLGFRFLKPENIWFRLAYDITVVSIVLQIAGYAIDVTYLNQIHSRLQIYGLGGMQTILRIATVFLLWKGIQKIYQKAGMQNTEDSALKLAVWYSVLVILILVSGSSELLLTGMNGWIIFAVILVSYIAILRSVYKEWEHLEQAGYSVQCSVVHVPSWVICVLIVLAAVIVPGISYKVIGNNRPMEWKQIKQEDNGKYKEICTHLVEIGYPKEWVYDLTKKDLEAMKNAVRVIVADFEPQKEDGSFASNVSVKSVYVSKNKAGSEWKVITHFSISDKMTVDGIDSIRIGIDGDSDGKKKSGYILCDRDGITYRSKMFAGENLYRSFDDILSFMREVRYGFSMPKGAVNQRGYVSYEVKNYNWEADTLLWGDSWKQLQEENILPEDERFFSDEITTSICYEHHALKFQYPSASLQERIMGDGEEDINNIKGTTRLRLLFEQESRDQ